MQRIVTRALALVDTDKARIALPLLDFFSKFLQANNSKTKELDPSSELFQLLGQLALVVVKRLQYPDWFMEMGGHTEDPDDRSDGRLDEHRALREAG